MREVTPGANAARDKLIAIDMRDSPERRDFYLFFYKRINGFCNKKELELSGGFMFGFEWNYCFKCCKKLSPEDFDGVCSSCGSKCIMCDNEAENHFCETCQEKQNIEFNKNIPDFLKENYSNFLVNDIKNCPFCKEDNMLGIDENIVLCLTCDRSGWISRGYILADGINLAWTRIEGHY